MFALSRELISLNFEFKDANASVVDAARRRFEASILSFNSFITSLSVFEVLEQAVKTMVQASAKAEQFKVVWSHNIKAGFPPNAENQLFL